MDRKTVKGTSKPTELQGEGVVWMFGHSMMQKWIAVAQFGTVHAESAQTLVVNTRIGGLIGIQNHYGLPSGVTHTCENCLIMLCANCRDHSPSFTLNRQYPSQLDRPTVLAWSIPALFLKHCLWASESGLFGQFNPSLSAA